MACYAAGMRRLSLLLFACVAACGKTSSQGQTPDADAGGPAGPLNLAPELEIDESTQGAFVSVVFREAREPPEGAIGVLVCTDGTYGCALPAGAFVTMNGSPLARDDGRDGEGTLYTAYVASNRPVAADGVYNFHVEIAGRTFDHAVPVEHVRFTVAGQVHVSQPFEIGWSPAIDVADRSTNPTLYFSAPTSCVDEREPISIAAEKASYGPLDVKSAPCSTIFSLTHHRARDIVTPFIGGYDVYTTWTSSTFDLVP